MFLVYAASRLHIYNYYMLPCVVVPIWQQRASKGNLLSKICPVLSLRVTAPFVHNQFEQSSKTMTERPQCHT